MTITKSLSIQEIKEKIKAYIRLNPHPNAKILPTAWIYWENTKHEGFSLNLMTGQESPKRQSWMRTDWSQTDAIAPNMIDGKNNRVWFARGRKIVASYINIDKKLQIAELAFVTINTNKNNNCKRQWEYDERWEKIYMPIGQPEVYRSNGEQLAYNDASHFTVRNADWWCGESTVKGYLWSLGKYDCAYVKNESEALQLLTNNYTFFAYGHFCQLINFYELNRFFQRPKKAGKKPPAAQTVENLTNNYPLKPFAEQCLQQLSDETKYGERCRLLFGHIANSDYLTSVTTGVTLFEPVTHNICVLRYGILTASIPTEIPKAYFSEPLYTQQLPYTQKLQLIEFTERNRLYLIKSEKSKKIRNVFCHYNSYDKIWATATWNSLDWYATGTHYGNFFLNTEELKQSTEWPQYASIAWAGTEDFITIKNICTHGIFERLAKLSIYPFLLKQNLFNRANWKTQLECTFGVLNEKSTDIYHYLGINKKQLEYVTSHTTTSSHQSLTMFKEIKIYTKLDTLIDYPQTKFELLVKFASIPVGQYYVNLHHKRENLFPEKKYEISSPFLCYSQEDKNTILEHLLRLEDKDPGTINLYYDTIQLYNRLHVKDLIDLRPMYKAKNMLEAERWHNIIVDIYNSTIQVELDERAAAERALKQKLLKEVFAARKLWERANDKYIIQVAPDANSIRLEGQKLGHCVAGYADSHITGTTTILFLRKAESPDQPWFTIEVNAPESYNAKAESYLPDPELGFKIKQLYGYQNQHLCASNEGVEALPFVIEWLRETGIKCDNIEDILLSRRSSYGGGGPYVEWPEDVEKLEQNKEVV